MFKKNNIFTIIVLLVIFNFKPLLALQSDWIENPESKVRIISPISENNGLKTFYLGLEYQLKEGWKTYWLSPGEGGFPQEINWGLSKNIQNIQVLWPTPKYFEILGSKSIGYENEVIFPLEIKIKNPEKETSINLDINYLICKEICIPGSANVNLLIPSGEGNITDHAYKIEKSLALVPKKNIKISNIEDVNANAYYDEKEVTISIKVTSKQPFKNPNIFLNSEFGLPVIEPIISYSNNYKSLEAKFILDRNLISKSTFDLEIILKDKNSLKYDKKIILERQEHFSFFQNSIIYYLLISFIGGVILNFMPCVFPVLSIKILSFLKNKEKFNYHKSFLITSSGIITSFFILSLILILLRYIGINITWGMQFQQPYFLMIIFIILMIFTLNLLGLFEFTVPRFVNSNFFYKLINREFSKDFFNGFFATILATPCTAPLVGTAITLAFTQSNYMMISIFCFMGLGMSLPYLLFYFFPNFISIFPKPGKWMNLIKLILVFLLIGTIIWILFILSNHFNYIFFISIIIILLFSILALYYLKLNMFVLLLSSITFFSLPSFSILKLEKLEIDSDWIVFSEKKIEDLIKENNIVFVDITADWCATCQFNKINVINSSTIKDLFTKNKVIKLRGDWTKRNKDIEKYLIKNNRYGIPLNIIYSKKYPEGEILSELLTVNELKKTFAKIK